MTLLLNHKLVTLLTFEFLSLKGFNSINVFRKMKKVKNRVIVIGSMHF